MSIQKTRADLKIQLVWPPLLWSPTTHWCHLTHWTLGCLSPHSEVYSPSCKWYRSSCKWYRLTAPSREHVESETSFQMPIDRDVRIQYVYRCVCVTRDDESTGMPQVG
jgi:hypothetical protein